MVINIKEGIVKDKLSRSEYVIELLTEEKVEARLSGKAVMNNLEVDVGDLVFVEISPYDLSKGRIMTYSAFKTSNSRLHWTDLHKPKPR